MDGTSSICVARERAFQENRRLRLLSGLPVGQSRPLSHLAGGGSPKAVQRLPKLTGGLTLSRELPNQTARSHRQLQLLVKTSEIKRTCSNPPRRYPPDLV